MNDIRKEYKNLSKQGKFNLHYYLISLILLVLMFSLTITSLVAYDNLQNQIVSQQKQIDYLNNQIIKIIADINGVGG